MSVASVVFCLCMCVSECIVRRSGQGKQTEEALTQTTNHTARVRDTLTETAHEAAQVIISDALPASNLKRKTSKRDVTVACCKKQTFPTLLFSCLLRVMWQ